MEGTPGSRRDYIMVVIKTKTVSLRYLLCWNRMSSCISSQLPSWSPWRSLVWHYTRYIGHIGSNDHVGNIPRHIRFSDDKMFVARNKCSLFVIITLQLDRIICFETHITTSCNMLWTYTTDQNMGESKQPWDDRVATTVTYVVTHTFVLTVTWVVTFVVSRNVILWPYDERLTVKCHDPIIQLTIS